jgi:hypothetical protein
VFPFAFLFLPYAFEYAFVISRVVNGNVPGQPGLADVLAEADRTVNLAGRRREHDGGGITLGV